jgi:hypothetical protein
MTLGGKPASLRLLKRYFGVSGQLAYAVERGAGRDAA